jgi:uncharacterized membrane protein YcaP (DUF421 family)
MVDFLETALGLSQKELIWWQMCIRAALVFLISLGYIRIANKRIFGKFSAFDIVLGVMYGSVMSRAITGNAPFFATLAAGLSLILLHRLLAFLSLRVKHGSPLSNFIKGQPIPLVLNGNILKDALQKHSITERDLQEALRSNGGPVDLAKIETAYLERSGDISLIMKKEN